MSSNETQLRPKIPNSDIKPDININRLCWQNIFMLDHIKININYPWIW
ncbi:hypothetical protein SIPHO049v1_p0066 [Vibrio phage PS14A.1]|nr:hypothetical protein SIPHO049v1_p0066 [Vibrio phage PS14A.1]